MALPINVNDLLKKQKVESERIEFKKGWNPVDIYHTICAFANDFDNLGGGYILVGVEEHNGMAQRPVIGVEADKIDDILKQMVGLNNLIDPYYLPRTSIEEVYGKLILVIWVPSGVNRPYAVPSDVFAKAKQMKYYVRSGSSSIIAKGEVLDELRDMANRVPFDERVNPNIQPSDISMVLLRDYLAKSGSRLERALFSQPIEQTLEQMDLMDGPTENRMIKNVAAMMFSESPEKFFKYTQVDIVVFPQGRLKGPNNFSETTIHGSVPQMINGVLTYLKNNVIREYVIKQKDRPESIRYFNYPIQALEEAVVNALYHRDYQQYEPVEISIEPQGIYILSFPGPDRSISNEAIEKGAILHSRRYRNRRLGDFLKELDLTEGRSTGIPTIQEELQKNGSPRAVIETNAERSFINVFIPVHDGCEDTVILNKEYYESQGESVNDSVNGTVNETVNETVNGTVSDIENDIENDIVNDIENVEISESERLILKVLSRNNWLTYQEIAGSLKKSVPTVSRNIAKLKSKGLIERIGSDKDGFWKVNKIER